MACRDKRWTVHNKVFEYREMIKLQKREREILEFNAANDDENCKIELSRIRHQCKKMTDELRNARLGNEQYLRTTFAHHRDLQMAYCKRPTDQIVEHIRQLLFNDRKSIDRQKCLKSKLMKTFKDMLLDKSICEDRVISESYGVMNSFDRKLKNLNGEIQAMKIQLNAAITVRDCYNECNKILLKDSMFYDTMVDKLKTDLQVQCDMILRAAFMGQVATEYREDLKDDLATLERNTIKEMTYRENDLRRTRKKVDNFKRGLKKLVRTDSDIAMLYDHEKYVTEDEVSMLQECDFILDALTNLQKGISCQSLEYIVPHLLSEWNNNQHLSELVDHYVGQRDLKLMQLAHSELALSMQQHTYGKANIEFIENENSLKEQKAEEKNRLKNYEDQIARLVNPFLFIRRSIVNLNSILRTVVNPARKGAQNKVASDENDYDDVTMSKKYFLKMSKPSKFSMADVDVLQQIAAAKIDLGKVMEKFYELSPEEYRKAHIFCDKFKAVDSLLDDKADHLRSYLGDTVFMPDSKVPTNKSIKEESEEIINDNTIDDMAMLAEQIFRQTKPKYNFN